MIQPLPPPPPPVPGPARIESLRVRNYRALRDLSLDGITPLTVVAGPNGSGKSTLFDVFAFLAEAFESGLRRAWDRRGRGREIRSRGSEGPVEFTIEYREPELPPITYHLAIEDSPRGPAVAAESLRWRHLYPRLLSELAEECRAASERSQVLVSTHSPFLVNGIRPEELRLFHRGDDGYTRTVRSPMTNG